MDEKQRAERKRKFQESIRKMKPSSTHSDAGKPIDMIPYMKEHPESVKGFLKDAVLKEHEHYANMTKKKD